MRSATFLAAFCVVLASTLAALPELRTSRTAKAATATKTNILDAFLTDENLQKLAEEHTKRLKPNLRHDAPVVGLKNRCSHAFMTSL